MASSCTIWLVDRVATAGPTKMLGGLVSGGASVGGQRGWIPYQAGCNLPKAWRWCYPQIRHGDPHDDIELDSLSAAILLSSDCQCWALLPTELWIWQHCLNSPRVGGVCLAGITSCAGCITSVQPGWLLLGTFLSFPTSCCIEGYLAPQWAPPQ